MPDCAGMSLETLSIEGVSGEWMMLEERECPRGRVERRRSWPFVAAAFDRLQHDVSAAVAFGVLRPLDRFPMVATSGASRLHPLCCAHDSTHDVTGLSRAFSSMRSCAEPPAVFSNMPVAASGTPTSVSSNGTTGSDVPCVTMIGMGRPAQSGSKWTPATDATAAIRSLSLHASVETNIPPFENPIA